MACKARYDNATSQMVSPRAAELAKGRRKKYSRLKSLTLTSLRGVSPLKSSSKISGSGAPGLGRCHKCPIFKVEGSVVNVTVAVLLLDAQNTQLRASEAMVTSFRLMLKDLHRRLATSCRSRCSGIPRRRYTLAFCASDAIISVTSTSVVMKCRMGMGLRSIPTNSIAPRPKQLGQLSVHEPQQARTRAPDMRRKWCGVITFVQNTRASIVTKLNFAHRLCCTHTPGQYSKFPQLPTIITIAT